MQKDILLINGVPRSGTSAIGSMLGKGDNCAYRFQPLFSYKYRDKARNYKGVQGLSELVKELDTCKDSFIQNGMVDAKLNLSESNQTDIMIIKHVRYHENLLEWLESKAVKLLCVIRDPRACIYSQVSIPTEWGGSISDYPDWINAPHINHNEFEYFGFSGWLRFCFLSEMLKLKFPDQVKILRYEDFNSDAYGSLQQIVDEFQLPISLQNANKDKDKTSHTYGVSSRSDRNWKVSLDPEIRNDIETVCMKLKKGAYLCD